MRDSGVAVVTIASGRHQHLLRQRAALARNGVQPALHVVVALGDPDLPGVVASGPSLPPVLVEPFSGGGGRLPLAAARNRGAELALRRGAEILVFLDVDCLPGPRLVERYATAVREAPGPALFSGPVAYLPPPPEGGYDLDTLGHGTAAHPARPVPDDDAVLSGADHRLFWSLSFAVGAGTWRALGGFSEIYDGYGAEDTDFGQLARSHGVGHAWVGGAWAYHQHHPTTDPPLQHLADIVRNAAVFHRRWGWWPMQGWLDAFAERGLARHDAVRDEWLVVEEAVRR